MPATCAICQQPIIARHDVRVFGTEVMHRACAISGRQTVAVKQQQEIATLRAELSAAREAERRAVSEVQRARAAQCRAEDALRAMTARHADALIVRDEACAAEATAGRLLTQALRERDDARSELAKRTTAHTDAPEDTRDPAVIRASLLELD